MWRVSDRNSATPNAAFRWKAKPASPVWVKVKAAAQEHIDATSLAVFRISIGLVGVLIVARFFAYGWVDDLYIELSHHFTDLGFGWVKPWPSWGMYAHFVPSAFWPRALQSGTATDCAPCCSFSG